MSNRILLSLFAVALIAMLPGPVAPQVPLKSQPAPSSTCKPMLAVFAHTHHRLVRTLAGR